MFILQLEVLSSLVQKIIVSHNHQMSAIVETCVCRSFQNLRASLVAQTAKNPPAMPDTWLQSLGREDPLQKGMAAPSRMLAWKIPWTEEPGGLQSMVLLRVRHDFTLTFHFHALEKEMATHFSVLAWRIPGTGEPGGLPSMGSHRVRHD